MGPWKHLRSMCACHRFSPDEGLELQDINVSGSSKVLLHFPDQYHVLKITCENEVFFYKFIPEELRKHVPEACAKVTPDCITPRLLPFACLGSVDKRAHYEEFDYERRNGGLPHTGKTLLVMRDVKADMIDPCWVDFELGCDSIDCLRMSGISIYSSESKDMLTKAEMLTMNLAQMKIKLESFLHAHIDLIDLMIAEINTILAALLRVSGISFNGTSILIAFDAAARTSSHYRVEVKLLGFRNVKLSSEPNLFVLNGLITLREMLKSIQEKGYDLM